MVIEHDRKAKRVLLNPCSEAFCREWGGQAKACAPYRARTKGATESGVKYVKCNALAGLSFTSFAALEAHLANWTAAADARTDGNTRQALHVLFEQDERAALRRWRSTWWWRSHHIFFHHPPDEAILLGRLDHRLRDGTQLFALDASKAQ